MGNLITIADIRLVRPVADNIPADKYEFAIHEAQKTDLKKALNNDCKDFLHFIEQNVGVTRIDLLLNGGTYEFGDDTFSFEGLKVALAYYAYARLISNTDITVTGNNVVKKTNEWSELLDEPRMEKQNNIAKGIAYGYVQEVILLLCRKPADYPEWGGQSDAPTGFGMTVVDKHQRNGRRNRYL